MKQSWGGLWGSRVSDAVFLVSWGGFVEPLSFVAFLYPLYKTTEGVALDFFAPRCYGVLALVLLLASCFHGMTGNGYPS